MWKLLYSTSRGIQDPLSFQFPKNRLVKKIPFKFPIQQEAEH